MCESLIQWCINEKRTFLKHRIEIKLSQLLLTTGKSARALEIIENLLKEVRKADDKHLLVEGYLVES